MDSQRARKLKAKKIGVLLQDARLALGRSRKALADELGVSSAQLAAYERGEKAPSLPELEALAFALRVPLEHFWGSEVLLESSATGEEVDLARLVAVRQRKIGAKLQQLRESAGLTLAETARRAGITPHRLRTYELAERPIPVPELEALAAALDVPVQSFMDTDGPIGEWLVQQRQIAGFLELPPELREFVSKPVNRPYLELAQRLSEMSVEKLRAVAEGLLEITL